MEVDPPVQRNVVRKVKVLIIGDDCVGKSSLVNRLIHGKFPEISTPTISACIFKYTVSAADNQDVELSIWDTESYKFIFAENLEIYCKKLDVAIILYDVTNKMSFTLCEDILSRIRAICDQCLIALVGNKKDVPEDRIAVSTQVAYDLASREGYLFGEVSAWSGEGVPEFFQLIAHKMLESTHESVDEKRPCTIS